MEPAQDNRTGVPTALATGMDALRIQAAAVAAQQMALLERETRLEKSRDALAQHEAQLASHLQEKRERLVELRDECRKARDELQESRLRFERELVAESQRLDAARVELADSHRQLMTDRRRLLALRKRLKQRLHRHWLATRQEHEVASRALAGQQEQCHNERERLAQARRQFEGEMELGRRRLVDLERSLKEQHRVREAAFALEESRMKDRVRETESRGAGLGRAAAALSQEKTDWERLRAWREAEANGLENRILNARRKLLALRLEAGPADSRSSGSDALCLRESLGTTCRVVSSAGGGSGDENRATTSTEPSAAIRMTLASVFGELADQRLLLAEHWRRIARIGKNWHEEHRTALDDLENRRRELDDREGRVMVDEQDAVRRREDLDRGRSEVESIRTRLRVAELTWESERNRLLADVEIREGWLEQRELLLGNLRRRWQERRRRDLERWREEMATLGELSDQYGRLSQEALRRESMLIHDRRTVTESALATEQFRQEYLVHAPNPAAAEKRLEQIRRSWAQQLAREGQALVRKQDAFRTISAAVEARLELLRSSADETLSRETALARREEEQDMRSLANDKKFGATQKQLHVLRVQNHDLERRTQELQDEVERMARLLLDQPSPTPSLRAHAA